MHEDKENLSSIVDLVRLNRAWSMILQLILHTSTYVVIADQQKEGRDVDSIKQFSIQPHLHIFTGGKICRVELCIELLYPYLVSLLFADLLSLRMHLVTFLVLNSCVLLKDMIGLAT